MSFKGGKIHGISACSTSWLPVAIPAPPPPPSPSPSPSPLTRKQLLRAHSPSYISSSCKPATTNILLALSILSHIVLHSTYFPLYIPLLITLIHLLLVFFYSVFFFSPSFFNSLPLLQLFVS
jgi:hypothetical protein